MKNILNLINFVIPAKARFDARRAGIYSNRFLVPPSLTVRLHELFVHGSRSAFRRAGKHGMTISILAIFIFGLIGSKALFHSGFYTSHDGEHQLVRQYVFEQGLKDRQIPVRFNRQLYNGFGYPLFFFTYRLPFYSGEVFRIAGFSFADSIKAVFFVAYIF